MGQWFSKQLLNSANMLRLFNWDSWGHRPVPCSLKLPCLKQVGAPLYPRNKRVVQGLETGTKVLFWVPSVVWPTAEAEFRSMSRKHTGVSSVFHFRRKCLLITSFPHGNGGLKAEARSCARFGSQRVKASVSPQEAWGPKGCHRHMCHICPGQSPAFWWNTFSLAKQIRNCMTLCSFSPPICELSGNNSGLHN